MEIIASILILTVYLLPSILGSDKMDAGGILMLNIFLGWTIIGYVIALERAVAHETEPEEY